MKRAILAHYHEIILKGKNRGWFENRLQQNIVSMLKGTAYDSIQRYAGRIIIALQSDSNLQEIIGRLKTVFGIANFAPAWEVPADIRAIEDGLEEVMRTTRFQSFKVDSRRGTKDFPMDSQQLNQSLGAYIKQRTNASVRMDKPDAVFHVEIVGDRAFLYVSRLQGAGGLPSGTGGKVLCLLSGGIDSPVAAFKMMRRGCRVHFIHFHSYPHTTLESQEKVRRILRTLSCYQVESHLYLVPFADLQKEVVAYAPPGLRVVLYRRFMMRIAEAIAHKEKAAALVTGESLGQVASQTLENIRTISAVTTIPIFRPLIGDDKEEIIKVAREIGTYDISILADQDCCSLFIPKHPETMCSQEQAERAEELLDVARLVQNAVMESSHETISFNLAAPTESQTPCPQDKKMI